MSLLNFVNLYREVNLPEIVNDKFTAIFSATDAVVKQLNGIKPPFEIIEIYQDNSEVELEFLVAKKQKIEVTIRLGKGGKLKHYNSLCHLLETSEDVKSGKMPEEFYLFEENIYYPHETNLKIKKLADICELISSLTKLAHYHDSKSINEFHQLVFVTEEKSPVVLEVAPLAELIKTDFSELAVLSSLTHPSAKADFHFSEKLSVFYSSLQEFINKELNPVAAFNYLLVNFNQFISLFQKNLTTYSSGFGFHKAKKEVADTEIKFAEELSKIMGDIIGKLFSIPISFAAAITLISVKNIVWVDLIIELGLLLATVFVIGAIENQKNRFKIVEKSKSLVLGAIEGEQKNYPEDLSSSIKDMKKIVSQNMKRTKYWLVAFWLLAWTPALLGAAILSIKYF